MTIILAFFHAFGTNKNFDPLLLYFVTFIIDLAILDAFTGFLP